MRYALLLALLLALALPTMAAAQSDCALNLPCQAIPWRVPVLPRMLTPTPMPTVVLTQVSGNAAGPTPMVASTLSAVDTTSLNSQVATLQTIINATPVRVANADGAYDATPDVPLLGSQALTFFSYIKGLGNVNMGVITPLIVFLITGFFITFSIRMGSIFAPVGAVVFGFIRKVASLIMDFLPL